MAASCFGRSSPVTLAFEPVVDRIHYPGTECHCEIRVTTVYLPRNGSQLPLYNWYQLLLGGERVSEGALEALLEKLG